MAAERDKDPKTIDIEQLGTEELDSIEFNEKDEIIQKPDDSKKDIDDKDPEKKPPEEDPDKKVETQAPAQDPDKKVEKLDPEKDPDKKPPEEDPDKKVETKAPEADPDKKDDVDTEELSEEDLKEIERLGGTKKVFKMYQDTKKHSTEMGKKAATSQKALDDLKSENLRKQQEQATKIDPELEAFRNLDDDEKDTFAQDNPKEFRKLLEADHKHEQTQTDIKQTNESNAKHKMAENMFGWMKEDKGIDYKKDPEAATEYLNSDEFTLVDQELNENYARQSDGTFTKKQMRSAYKSVNSDTILEQERVKTREQTLQNIENAAGKGSPLDRTTKQPGDAKHKDFADLATKVNSDNPDEVDKAMESIDEMGEQELNQWEKFIDGSGM